MTETKTRSVRVMLCCNDPRNGEFSGRLVGVEIGSARASGDTAITFMKTPAGASQVRIGRRVFQYQARQEWVGNWCWDGILMARDEALRLLRYLAQTGWCLEEAPVDTWKMWETWKAEK